jgi:hypothetical protein
MGHHRHNHQEEVREARASYVDIKLHRLCSVCELPIPPSELIVIDPKKGYFPWPSNVPKAARSMSYREPKWCCHYLCDPMRHRREKIASKRKHRAEKLMAVSNTIIDKIKSKPKRGYWTKEKLVEKLHFKESLVLRAIKALLKDESLKKKDGAYLTRRK